MHAGRRTSRLGSPPPTVLAAAILLLAAGCSSPTTPTPPGPISNTYVLVGAGDIGWCGSTGAEATARLLDGIDGEVFTAGDNAYPSGSGADFRDCYQPTWGRHRNRTHPVPGNHDYETPGALGYYAYFHDASGPDGQGYYSYNVGPWTVFALNSEIGVRAGSAQYQWLRNELTLNRTAPCTLAIWHKPLFSSGPNRDNPEMRDIFRLLYDFNADVVINGHDHFYERFSAQDADGRADPARGLQQFTVGTGGVPLYDPLARRPNSDTLIKAWGVLKLTLSDQTYSWDFIPVSGPHDSGTGSCR